MAFDVAEGGHLLDYADSDGSLHHHCVCTDVLGKYCDMTDCLYRGNIEQYVFTELWTGPTKSIDFGHLEGTFVGASDLGSLLLLPIVLLFLSFVLLIGDKRDVGTISAGDASLWVYLGTLRRIDGTQRLSEGEHSIHEPQEAVGHNLTRWVVGEA